MQCKQDADHGPVNKTSRSHIAIISIDHLCLVRIWGDEKVGWLVIDPMSVLSLTSGSSSFSPFGLSTRLAATCRHIS